MPIPPLILKIYADATGMSTGVAKANAQVTGLKSTFGAASSAMKIGLVVAGAAAVKFGIDSVKAFEESQKVMAQTTAVLKSTGGAANVTAGQVTGFAHTWQGLTGVQDEAIQSSENLLLTFRDVHNAVGEGNDIFNQAEVAIMDMATALDHGATPSLEDLQSKTIQLGKALNDPVRGMTALKKVGVSFTESQIATIKSLQDAGDLMGAQKIILGELTAEFGGAAKAAGQTFAGRLALLGAEFDDLKESVGKFLVQALTPLLPIISKLIALTAKLLPEIVALGVAFLAWKAFAFIPNLLLLISLRLEGLGAAGAASGVLKGATAIEALGFAIRGLLPFLSVAAGAYFIGTVPTSKQLSDMEFFQKQLEVAQASAKRLREGTTGGGFISAADAQRDITFTENYAKAQGLSVTATQLAIKTGRSYSWALSQVTQAAGQTGVAVNSLTDLQRAQAVQAIQDRNAQLALAGALAGLYGSLLSAKTAQEDVAKAQAKVNRLQDAGRTHTKAYRDAVDELHLAQSGSLTAQIGLGTAVEDYLAKVKSGETSQKEAIGQLKTFAEQAGLSKDQTRELVNELKDAIAKYNQLAHLPDITKHFNLIVSSHGYSHRSPLTGDPYVTQHGFHGMVTGPTLFLAGEAGAERVDVTPGGKRGGGAGTVILDRRHYVEQADYEGRFRGF